MDNRDGDDEEDRRRRGVLVIILVLVLLLAGGAVIGWLWWKDRDSGTAGASPASSGAPASGGQPVWPGGTIRDGDTVEGEVSNPGDTNRYDLVVVDDVQFSLIDVSANIGVRLVSPGEARTVTIPGPYEYAVERPGTYTLEITLKDGDTGRYGFRVLTRKLRRFEVKVGDRVGAGGVPGTGRLDVPGRVDVYVVNRAGAARIQANGATPCEGAHLGYSYESTSDTPDVSTPVHACGEWTSHALTESDQVALVVWSEEGQTVDYSLTIERAE